MPAPPDPKAGTLGKRPRCPTGLERACARDVPSPTVMAPILAMDSWWADIGDTEVTMGTTFVTLTDSSSGEQPGFWMNDGMLELWLRLLALHLPEPTGSGEFAATREIRNQWLLASRGYFMGCIPHGMEEACATPEGRTVVRMAIESLLTAFQRTPEPLDAATLGLLGFEHGYGRSIERPRLEDVGHAFLDLLDGKISCLASSTDVMPGSTPYRPI